MATRRKLVGSYSEVGQARATALESLRVKYNNGESVLAANAEATRIAALIGCAMSKKGIDQITKRYGL